MLNGMEFQTVGAAYLKALRPTAVLVKGTCRKLCDADRRVLEGLLRLMKGEMYDGYGRACAVENRVHFSSVQFIV